MTAAYKRPWTPSLALPSLESMSVTDRQLVGGGLAGALRVEPETFAVHGVVGGARLDWFVSGLADTLAQRGFHRRAEAGPDVQVVLHRVDPERARPYRRKSAPTFVIALAEIGRPADDVLRAGYPLLVRALANLCVMVSDGQRGPVVQFTTLEQGTYAVEHRGDDSAFFRAVIDRLEPLATSRLVIANEFRTDLPAELWEGNETTHQITTAGERLAALDLLPAPFPIEEILPPRDLRHVQLLYGLGGLSYGNISARRSVDGELGPEFWMSASGVDKAELHAIGRDILLVRGYDPELGAMVLSVPPSVSPRRVSVDAIEHWMIYREHPDVGAIVHVHAWIDGTRATEINYPCGTLELAGAVAALARDAPDPSRAVVGQKNHGLTITGRSLDEIFDRVGDQLVRNVPMD